MRLRDQVRADIVSGVWPLRSHITLAQLAAYYGVSANPVREALLQLQGEGVVAMRMNRGAVIPTVDKAYIDNLYRLRGAIQSMLARDAARLAKPADVGQMMALLEEHEKAAQRSDVQGCVEANRNFHRHVDALGGNPLAVDLLQGRSTLVDAFRRSVGYGAQRLEVVVAQHRRIAQFIAAGDQEGAGRAMVEHTETSRRDLLARCAEVNC